LELLTIPEAAARLKVHSNTVRRLIKAGELKASKVGRQWRIQASELERLTSQK
jgi:excisionase family DNA binding protein